MRRPSGVQVASFSSQVSSVSRVAAPVPESTRYRSLRPSLSPATTIESVTGDHAGYDIASRWRSMRLRIFPSFAETMVSTSCPADLGVSASRVPSGDQAIELRNDGTPSNWTLRSPRIRRRSSFPSIADIRYTSVYCRRSEKYATRSPCGDTEGDVFRLLSSWLWSVSRRENSSGFSLVDTVGQ